MAMTAAVKDELSRLTVSKPCCRKAEVSAILRFAGGLHISAGKIMVEIELDTAQAARRIRKDIADIYGHDSDLAVISAGGLRKGSRYLVRVIKDGDNLARQTGLVDSHGRPVRGLPPQVVSAGICCAEAAWRGAFLAHGSLTEPGRSSALEITCPGPEAALALVGAARRLAIAAKAREVRGVDRVVIRDGDAIGVLLTRLGAHESVMAWEERRMRREVRATANRLANFDDANLRRSARAAVAASARVARAMEILGEDIPDHLREAGQLRITHGQASLEELGSLSTPPMTKDAIAGRIRRLLAMADKRASDLGIPDTTTYAENIGVMAATRVYSTAAYWIAALGALVLSICPKFGALLSAIPGGVLGGAQTALFGMIGILGAKIWIESKVNFADSTNLIVAATAIIIGISDVSWTRGDFTFNGIINATLVAVIGYRLFNTISKSRGTSAA